ncbi:MAG: hypothetical protein Q8S13_01060 [Dehalococcoidia bacterium]|nr:hypothetical protein [Dehalococcoidia bacterium]
MDADLQVTWHDGTNGKRRGFAVVLGWDCRAICEHDQKGDHGIHGDEWNYIVGIEDAALVLTVSVSEWSAKSRPFPFVLGDNPLVEMTWHFAYPTSEEAIKDGEQRQACVFVPMGCIRSASGSSFCASSLWKAHAQPGRLQSETFWRTLETALDARLILLHEARRAVEDVSRCSHCGGAGVIRRQEQP